MYGETQAQCCQQSNTFSSSKFCYCILGISSFYIIPISGRGKGHSKFLALDAFYSSASDTGRLIKTVRLDLESMAKFTAPFFAKANKEQEQLLEEHL